MGLFDKLTQFSAAITKPLAKEGYTERAKSGKMKGGDWFTAHHFYLGDQKSASAKLNLLANPFEKQAIRDAFSGHYESIRGSAFGANLGHQAIMGAKNKMEPDEAQAPMIAKRKKRAEVIQAKRQAREQALQSASQRRGLGLSRTVATSPLGLQGDGAAVSQRRLIGE